MNVIVIGGGPSGILAAANAKNDFNTVTLFDGNEKLGKKLYITGKGRCNVTNNCPPQDFLSNVVSNSKFLYSGIYSFSPQDTIDLIESMGTKLKTERGNRVFPVSDKASDIIKALSTYAKNNGVDIKLEHLVKSVKKEGDTFEVVTNKGSFFADIVVVACGGKSYPTTGSTGFGYEIAKSFGHHIVDIKPALVPIDLKKYNKNLAGLSLKNVKATVKVEGKEFSEFGEMLFTHTGVSGPIVLSLSSKINRLDLKGAKFVVDLKPALSESQLDDRLIRDFQSYLNKDFKNYLPELMPKSLIDEFLTRLSFEQDKKINSITKENRAEIINILKNFSFEILNLQPVELGIITAGGVDTKEISPKTMESKLVSNLYFVGEVLDLDAVTGGFNIQIALSTGYLAGQDISQKYGG